MLKDPLLTDEAKDNIRFISRVLMEIDLENQQKENLASNKKKDFIDAEVINVRQISISDQRKKPFTKKMLRKMLKKKYEMLSLDEKKKLTDYLNNLPKHNFTRKMENGGGCIRRWFFSTFLGKKVINSY